MSFTDQKPRVATEEQVNKWGGSREAGKRFRCHRGCLVCEKCDGVDVQERWQSANREAEQRFWWLI